MMRNFGETDNLFRKEDKVMRTMPWAVAIIIFTWCILFGIVLIITGG